MNKSVVTNSLTILLMLLGHFISNKIIFGIGLFAFSGAITNWLAIHMLFEKIPGLYGSGVIPARFEDFKSAIRRMMMEQFFTQENLDRFMEDEAGGFEVVFCLQVTPNLCDVQFISYQYKNSNI